MPTATDRDFLDMPVSDVRLVTRFGRDQHVVLLQEPQSGRRLPIWIGQETAIEIALRQVATTAPRSLQGGTLQGRPGEWPPAAAVLGRQTDLKGAPGLIARHSRPSPHPPENQAAVS
jgi:Domain of unknown function (DUF151)